MTRRFHAARYACGALSLIAAALLAACHDKAAVSQENFTKTINDYLARRGNLCVGKFDWPIYVTTDDEAARTRDAQQMPVLEKLGLVAGKSVTVERKGEDGERITAQARQYDLTAEGQKYYLHVPVVIATAARQVTHSADFCVAKLTLDKVVGWEPPQQRDGETKTSVLYTYKVEPAAWTQDADVRRVFPMVQRVIEGAGTMQLRAGVRLTQDGWVAEEFFQR
ncbi:hypothetical protein [Cupriavidus malaysiensis]|uniref:Lipoprotein n=1 Tax=Cupriavidus malaysiensis TaxID=367825 RepID=A0ABM6FCE7_9BURK|nr:hypothetical protein [Cupriavidus malaysiensis]AOZ09417.1 hypothetical protein BKK80_26980 [Cupriavidus malaysiensis]